MAAEFLQPYLVEIERIFRSNTDHHASHELSREILLEMTGQSEFFPALFNRHLREPEIFNRQSFPIPGLIVAETPYFTCSVNFWLGGTPQLEQSRSMTCVHHHGSLLLTTLGIMGPGAEAWIFSRPRPSETDGLYRLDLLRKEVNSTGHFTFVDSEFCHMIFPPAAHSATITLWSKARHNRILNFLKYNPLIRRNRKRLSEAVRLFRLGGALQVNEVINFDFVPKDGGFEALSGRLQYPYSTNDDFLDTLFHLMNATGCGGQLAAVHETLVRHRARIGNAAGVESRFKAMERGDIPNPVIAPTQRFIEGLTVTRADVLRGLCVGGPR